MTGGEHITKKVALLLPLCLARARQAAPMTLNQPRVAWFLLLLGINLGAFEITFYFLSFPLEMQPC